MSETEIKVGDLVRVMSENEPIGRVVQIRSASAEDLLTNPFATTMVELDSGRQEDIDWLRKAQ